MTSKVLGISEPVDDATHLSRHHRTGARVVSGADGGPAHVIPSVLQVGEATGWSKSTVPSTYTSLNVPPGFHTL